MHRPEILGHLLELAPWAPCASFTHLEYSQHSPTCRIHKCNCTRRALSRGHRPDDQEPGKEVHSWMPLPKGKWTKEYKMSARGHVALDWAPTGWKPRINNNNNKKMSKACQLGRDIWLVIRGAWQLIHLRAGLAHWNMLPFTAAEGPVEWAVKMNGTKEISFRWRKMALK